MYFREAAIASADARQRREKRNERQTAMVATAERAARSRSSSRRASHSDCQARSCSAPASVRVIAAPR